MLVKADIKEAYRMLPIHPEDQGLLGIQWEGEVYTDKALPFRLRSAPKYLQQLPTHCNGSCQTRA